jgi:hypothetical protein
VLYLPPAFGLGLNVEHLALVEQELPRIGYKLFASTIYEGVGPEQHLILIGHLASTMGRRLALKSAPTWPIHDRVLEAHRLGLIHAVIHVLPLSEAIAGVEHDYITRQILLRPAMVTPIVVVDAADQVGLTWVRIGPWAGRS